MRIKEELLLRDYQKRVIDAGRRMLARDKRVIIYAPQGSGKSVIAAFMAISSAQKKLKVLILSHREEILKQNFDKIDKTGVDVQMIFNSTKTLQDKLIYCAMTQTLRSRCGKFEAWAQFMKTIDLVIVDEVHRGEHDELYQYFKENVWMIGLSASILRSGNMNQLGKYYQSVSVNVTTKELLSLKFLTPARHFSFQAPKVDGVEISHSTGDFVQKQLQEKFRSPDRYAGVIANYQKICPSTQCILFTTGSEHTVELCRAFNDAGISAKYLLSEKMPDTDNEYSDERKSLLRQFKNKEFRVLLNISILDTGFDAPGVECVALDFSTKSYAKYTQCIGRGSRLSRGKTCFYILDFGGNQERFGCFDSEPVVSLWHNPGGSGVAPTKECPTNKPDINGKLGCGRLLFISATDCGYCGYHFSSNKEIYEVELQEIIENQKEDAMTIKEWVAHKILEGWSIQRIFCAVMTKNSDTMRAAFEQVRQVVRTADGAMVSPDYYHYIKKFYLKKIPKK